MKLLRVSLLFLILTTLAVLGAACGSSGPSLPPSTPMAIPPTATKVLPTLTAAPTAPPSSGSPGDNGNLGSALDRIKTATSYRVDMQVTGSGALGAGIGEPPVGNSSTPTATTERMTFLSMQGEVNGPATHFSLQGVFASFLGADPSKPIEFMTIGDKAYIHGPVALIGATGDKWYQLPANESSVAKPPLTPGSLLDVFATNGLNPNDLKNAGAETLDNQSCTVYSGDKAVVERTFEAVGQAVGGGDQGLSTLDSADLRFWVCADGFLHQVRLAVQGHVQDKPDQTGSFLVQMHVHDIGTDIKIEAPANAEPLNMPSFINLGTPTP
jgi:hypothetical protein